MNSETDRVLNVLDTVKKLLHDSSTHEQQRTSKISLLMKLPSQNMVMRLCKDDTCSSSYMTSSIVDFLRACCFFQEGMFSSCLKLLQSVEKTSLSAHMIPMWEYLKGYCLYQENSFFEAAQCLHELLKSSAAHCDSIMKARCHNLIGCCLAKQDHPNTAIQTFRDAIHEDFTYLEPLYNISLMYRQQKLWDAELESLNLLVTAVENQELEESPASSDSGLVLNLSHENTQGIYARQYKCMSINLTSALYTLAKRCLELQRYSIAADKFLDLLAVLEESDILLQTSPRPSPNGIITIPNADIIYLEAALALSKSEQPEEALLLCDQIISKMTKPSVTITTGKDDEEEEKESVGSSISEFSRNTNLQNSGHPTDIASTSNDTRTLDSSKVPSTSARKRPRDDDSQSSKVIDSTLTPVTKPSQTKLRHLHLYCSTLLLKSQCCRTMKQFSKVTLILDEILVHLKGVTAINSMSRDSTSNDDEDSRSTCLGPQTKKRKLEKEEYDVHSTQPMSPQGPIIGSLLELKAQACNDKALMLIGQSRLQEAMKVLLKSLNYQPADNQDALYNYILLLLKMGRKQNARDAFIKYTGMRGATTNRLNELEKALR
ncbi:uncharacterized protein [Amphiura filiformis]|uniref:uncharacterized protein isoform X2 n=1 Tax=Amphiura filiformis TaxID=82378 RepID=UPI003B2262BC